MRSRCGKAFAFCWVHELELMRQHEWELIRGVLWWLMSHNPFFPIFSFLLFLIIVRFSLTCAIPRHSPPFNKRLFFLSLSSLEQSMIPKMAIFRL